MLHPMRWQSPLINSLTSLLTQRGNFMFMTTYKERLTIMIKLSKWAYYSNFTLVCLGPRILAIVICQKILSWKINILCTLCCIFLGIFIFGLETSVIIKISKKPCYSINVDWFSLGWSKKNSWEKTIQNGRLKNKNKKLRFSTPPILNIFPENLGY